MAKTMAVFLERLYCRKTTEAGEDEVYLLMFGKASDGLSFSGRLPGSRSHWDMNDGNRDISFRQVNQNLYFSPLADGAQLLLQVVIMEEDGGDPAAYVRAAAEAAKLIGPGNPYVQGGAAIAEAGAGFLPKDTDDVLGGFSLLAENKGDQVTLTWRADDQTRLVYKAETQAQIDRLGGDFLGTIIKNALKVELPYHGRDQHDLRQTIYATGDGGSYEIRLRTEIL